MTQIRLLAAAAVMVFSVAAPRAGSPAPAYRGDFPDPAVIVVGRTYWAYATGTSNRNLQVMSSPDLVHWSGVSDPLPVLPRWATHGLTWAPDVIRRGATFVMFYAVKDATSLRECISEATATSPAGPFVDPSAAPLVCQLGDAGSIDPSPFVDTAGRLFLLWKSDDDILGRPTHIWGQSLSPDARRLVGAPTQLLSETQGWQAPSAEGPAMIAHGGLYYLFYGGGGWNTSGSGIGYAICTGALGPCLNSSVLTPWLATGSGVTGPQGPDFFTAVDGTTKMAYAGWNGPVPYVRGGVRSMWIRTLSFDAAGPALH